MPAKTQKGTRHGAAAVEVRPLTAERWADLVSLFERPGPRGGSPMPANCYCMWWRQRTGDGVKNKRNMRALVAQGHEPGLLAYANGEAVGWVSVAPRHHYGQLTKSRQNGPSADEADVADVCSIVCFYIDPRFKGRGVTRALMRAALKHAVDRGARAVEAYPHVDGDYMGSADAFAKLGFERIREAGKRVVMRYEPARRRRSTKR
jgi:GNAT superfamily N-acetyltransferase